MKSVRIRLTAEQVAQLQPVVTVLEQHSHQGVGCIGQVLFYEDETVLLLGVMKPGPFTHIREFARNDCNLFELPPPNITSSRPPELAGLWDSAENETVAVNPAAADDYR